MGSSGFRILNVAIHNHPRRRTKAERNLFQGGIVPNLPSDSFRMNPRVVSRKATCLRVGSFLASCCPDHGNTSAQELSTSGFSVLDLF
jgi:hypothetical protein